MFINDGTGTGNSAKVDSKNRLLTKAASFGGEAIDSLEGNAFIVHGKTHIAAASTGGSLYIGNTSSIYNYFITRIFIDAQTLSDDIIIKQLFDTTRTSGTAVTPVNKNRGSGAALVGDFYVSDGSADMTFAGGTSYHEFLVRTLLSYTRDMGGSNIISPNTNIAWSWTPLDGGNGVNGEVISFSINLYRELVE